MRGHLAQSCEFERLDRALIALQGPKAEVALARLAPACTAMAFMDVRTLIILGVECIVTRSGYTGEDGFEISVAPERAVDVAAALLEDSNVALIGLGARDSLRLEAGLCLYGADLDETTTPVEAALTWAMQKARLSKGPRQGGFPGAAIVLEQIAAGTPRRRVGFLPEGRAPIRAGAAIFATQDAGNPIGNVTSGGFGPSIDRPIAMGYVPPDLAAPGQSVFAEVRGKRLAMTVTALPFVQSKFKRGERRSSSAGDLS